MTYKILWLQWAPSFISHFLNKHWLLENTNLAIHKDLSSILLLWNYFPFASLDKLLQGRFFERRHLQESSPCQSMWTDNRIFFSMRVLSKVSFQGTTLQYDDFLNLVSKGLGPAKKALIKTTLTLQPTFEASLVDHKQEYVLREPIWYSLVYIVGYWRNYLYELALMKRGPAITLADWGLHASHIGELWRPWTKRIFCNLWLQIFQ